MRQNDCLPGAHLLAGRESLVILPGQPVELLHHQAIRFFVGPLAFEFGRVVMLLVLVGTCGNDFGDAGSEFVRREVFTSKSFLDCVGKVRRVVLAVIKLESVPEEAAIESAPRLTCSTDLHETFSASMHAKDRHW